MILKYILFAFLAIFCNLFCQHVILNAYEGFYSLQIAMFFGTLISLILKYSLDKKYIFHSEFNNKIDDSFKFILYSVMGIITTIIFWSCEWIFNYLFQSEYFKYIGAFVGLVIGYIIKYFLDKKFVF